MPMHGLLTHEGLVNWWAANELTLWFWLQLSTRECSGQQPIVHQRPWSNTYIMSSIPWSEIGCEERLSGISALHTRKKIWMIRLCHKLLECRPPCTAVDWIRKGNGSTTVLTKLLADADPKSFMLLEGEYRVLFLNCFQCHFGICFESWWRPKTKPWLHHVTAKTPKMEFSVFLLSLHYISKSCNFKSWHGGNNGNDRPATSSAGPVTATLAHQQQSWWLELSAASLRSLG